MKVSWLYTTPRGIRLEQDYKYLENNKHFIRLANVIHVTGDSPDLETLRTYLRTEKKEEEYCSVEPINSNFQEMITEMFGNVSTDPIYIDDITEETLELAGKIYFGVAFCPDIFVENETDQFYRNLFENEMFSLETILKTLARILFVSNDKKLTEHYDVAKFLFDKITSMVSLQYKDIAVLTTSKTQLEFYKELRKHKQKHKVWGHEKERATSEAHSYMEYLINHPVHISEEEDLGAFIPFCFIGKDLVGRKSVEFQVPICNVFRKTILNGQVCYEANINNYKDQMDNWAEAEQIGFSFIVDTNDEYDVKNLIERKSPKEKEKLYDLHHYSTSYKKSNDEEEEFQILLETISIFFPPFFIFLRVFNICLQMRHHLYLVVALSVRFVSRVRSSKLFHILLRIRVSFEASNDLWDLLCKDPVPLVLNGRGRYNLWAIKDIEVTEELVGLGQGVTDCQMEEHRTDCQTRRHRSHVINTCRCSPYNMRSYYGLQVTHKFRTSYRCDDFTDV